MRSTGSVCGREVSAWLLFSSGIFGASTESSSLLQFAGDEAIVILGSLRISLDDGIAACQPCCGNASNGTFG